MGTDDTNRIRVEILGNVYTLKGHSTEAHLRKVSELVDQVMHQVASANPHMDQKRLAVLTALNLADELCKLRDEYNFLAELLEDKTQT